MQRVLALALAAAASAEVYFEESFDGDWEKRWVVGAPPGKEAGKWAVTPGKWFHDCLLYTSDAADE